MHERVLSATLHLVEQRPYRGRLAGAGRPSEQEVSRLFAFRHGHAADRHRPLGRSDGHGTRQLGRGHHLGAAQGAVAAGLLTLGRPRPPAPTVERDTDRNTAQKGKEPHTPQETVEAAGGGTHRVEYLVAKGDPHPRIVGAKVAVERMQQVGTLRLHVEHRAASGEVGGGVPAGERAHPGAQEEQDRRHLGARVDACPMPVPARLPAGEEFGPARHRRYRLCSIICRKAVSTSSVMPALSAPSIRSRARHRVISMFMPIPTRSHSSNMRETSGESTGSSATTARSAGSLSFAMTMLPMAASSHDGQAVARCGVRNEKGAGRAGPEF